MSGTVPVRVGVNGHVHEDSIEPRLLLIHYLRDGLGLTGSHVGCDTTNCGACTVLAGGPEPRRGSSAAGASRFLASDPWC